MAINVQITTSSQAMNFPLPAGTPPVILINGQQVASPGPMTFPTGYQMLIFDSTKELTDPTALIYNQYYFVYPDQNLWMDTYTVMYAQMCRDLLLNGNLQEQTRFFVSFGLDNNMGPDYNTMQVFFGSGADGLLQKWELNSDPGSQSGAAGSWVVYPASYILAGGFGFNIGEANELYQPTAGNAVLQYTTG